MKTSTRKLNIALLLMAALTLSAPAFAKTTGEIDGRVIDSENQPVEFATAVLKSIDTRAVAEMTMSDNNGYFIFDDADPGYYYLLVSKVGYSKSEPILVKIESDFPLIIEKDIVLTQSEIQLPEVIISAKSTQPSESVTPEIAEANFENMINADSEDFENLYCNGLPVIVGNNIINPALIMCEDINII